MKKVISIILCALLICGSVGISAFAAEENSFYLVLGDSIAYGSGLANPVDACYGKIVADTNGYDYKNHAVPGYTTTNLINLLLTENVIADVEKADIISISIGGNDFLLSDIATLMFEAIVKEDYSSFDTIGEIFYENFSEIVNIINGYNEDAVILMQTLYNPQSGNLRAPYQQGADRINSAIERYAQDHPGEIVIVDVGARLGDDMDNYAGDDIHPSAKGNELIARAVLEKLYELGLGENTEPYIAQEGEDIKAPLMFTLYTDILGFVFGFLGKFYKALTSIFSW